MSLCSQSFDTDKLTGLILKIHSTLTDMASNSFDQQTEVIEQLARAKQLFIYLDELKDLIVGSALSGILCGVIKQFNLEVPLSLIEDKANTLNGLIFELDDAISNIDSDNFDTFEGVESAVSQIFEPFEEEKESLFDYIKNETREVFSVLVYIGASQSVVDDAIAEVELSANIKQYILDVFDEVLNQVLSDLQ